MNNKQVTSFFDWYQLAGFNGASEEAPTLAPQ